MAAHRKRPIEEVRRLLYTREEAATALGISVDLFEQRVQPFIKLVPVGRLLLVPPSELERYIREHARHLIRGVA